jgi:hypothetical protein
MVGIVAILRDVTKRFEEMKALRKEGARPTPSACCSGLMSDRRDAAGSSGSQATLLGCAGGGR